MLIHRIASSHTQLHHAAEIRTIDDCEGETRLQGYAVRTAKTLCVPTSQMEVKISTNLMKLENRRLALPKLCPSQISNLLWLESENR